MRIGQLVAFAPRDGEGVTATITGFGDKNGKSGYKRLHLRFEDGSTLNDVLHAGDAPKQEVAPARKEVDKETGAVTVFDAVTEPVGPYWELLLV